MSEQLTLAEQQQMLDDWRALCEWLEARRYNASYDPRSKAAYLLTGPCPAYRTVQVQDTDAEPRTYGGRTVYPLKTIPNPKYQEELAEAKRCRLIMRERRRLGVVFWSVGHGWRLRRNYQERLAQEQQRIDGLIALVQA